MSGFVTWVLGLKNQVLMLAWQVLSLISCPTCMKIKVKLKKICPIAPERRCIKRYSLDSGSSFSTTSTMPVGMQDKDKNGDISEGRQGY